MALSSGTKLGPYEIVEPRGTGGMGEVYRARDTRLDRSVAIKILPSHLSDNPEARQRFDREARAISSLNHPNICTLHDMGHQDGIDFLVMEFLEGETLAERLIKGPLRTEQVLKISIELCDGLERAHRSGVVHRDLKPGNIMLTRTGAKLMDFGLAKAVTANPPSPGLTETLMTPGASQPLTGKGMVVGTFQYMAPEQVEGNEADARGDIFALGAVLYEMATGRRAFTGKSQASVVAAILASDPPPISSVQPMSPVALDRVVRTCLAKDPDDRFQSVHDLKLQLKWIAEGGSQAGVPAPASGRRRNLERVAWSVAAGAVLAAVALGIVAWRKPKASEAVVRTTILPPEKGTFVFLGATTPPLLSPDGRSIAFIARTGGVTQIWVRALDSFTARALAGTEDAYEMFWSPDSRNLGFITQGKLKRIPAAGGPPFTLCDVDQARGGSWSSQDVIIFGRYPGEIYRVRALGGSAPEQLTHFDPVRHDTTHRWPYFLPDGNHFLYLASTVGSVNEGNVFYLGSLDGKVNRVLAHGSSVVEYANGFLLYMVERTLMARPFDLGRLDFTGEAVAVAEGVEFDPIFSNGTFSVSQNGILVYQMGSGSSARSVNFFDAAGKPVGEMAESTSSTGPRVSPDGRRLAYMLVDRVNGKGDIWIQDIASGNRTRLTIDPVRSLNPVWSRDGSKIAYASLRIGKAVIYVKQADGMGVEKKVWEPPVNAMPNDWTLDGKTLIVQERPATGKTHLVLVAVDGTGQPSTLLESSVANIRAGQLSPDGRWIAYQSDESGQNEIYVAAFPKPAGSVPVSLTGGKFPTWRRDGKELYYLAPDGNLIASELKESGGSLQVTSRRTLFQTNAVNPSDTYDAFPDGKKFLVDKITTADTTAPLNLVENWTAELKK
jgi:Tol biopolymer transport system component